MGEEFADEASRALLADSERLRDDPPSSGGHSPGQGGRHRR
jgi:hypothetical protein